MTAFKHCVSRTESNNGSTMYQENVESNQETYMAYWYTVLDATVSEMQLLAYRLQATSHRQCNTEIHLSCTDHNVQHTVCTLGKEILSAPSATPASCTSECHSWPPWSYQKDYTLWRTLLRIYPDPDRDTQTITLQKTSSSEMKTLVVVVVVTEITGFITVARMTCLIHHSMHSLQSDHFQTPCKRELPWYSQLFQTFHCTTQPWYALWPHIWSSQYAIFTKISPFPDISVTNN